MEHNDSNENNTAKNSFSEDSGGYTKAPDSSMGGQPIGGYPYGPPVPPQPQESPAFAVAGMVCGIISLVCCCTGYLALIVGIGGLVLSIVSLVQKKPGKEMAIVGIVCSSIAIVMLIFLIVLASTIPVEDLQEMQEMIDELS